MTETRAVSMKTNGWQTGKFINLYLTKEKAQLKQKAQMMVLT